MTSVPKIKVFSAAFEQKYIKSLEGLVVQDTV